MKQTILKLDHINKSFGENQVLHDISLNVAEGEFITFLGPSGCGKTTMLRIIAGLLEPDNGRVFIGGEDVTSLPPNKRNVNTIFQNYALFPHMDVETNIGYGLRVKGVKKAEIKERVKKMLSLVQLDGFEKKMPNELSGGQRQRVAIARAAVNNPRVLLLDEPLGALDLQLRRYMQTELKSLQTKLGITFIYITHDQEEAMNMSDRIVVMRDGRFEQIDTPSRLYDHPKTSFAASFVGMANLIDAEILSVDGNTINARTSAGDVLVPISGDVPTADMSAVLCIRSENVLLSKEHTSGALAADVTDSTYANGLMTTRVRLSDGAVISSAKYGLCSDFHAGDTVFVSFASAVVVDGRDSDEKTQ